MFGISPVRSEEIKLLDYQMITSILFIGTIIVSIITTYNQKLLLEGQKPLFSSSEMKDIILINKIIVFILAIVYLWIDSEDLKVAQQKNMDTTIFELDIIPSLLFVIGAIIVIYTIMLDRNTNIGNISEVENPTI